MKTKYYITGDGILMTAEQAAAALLVQDPECGEGFLTRASDKEYAELITSVRVHYSAIDGEYKKTFKSVDSARDFVKKEWPSGDVAYDGVNRFDGYSVAHSNTTGKNYFPAKL